MDTVSNLITIIRNGYMASKKVVSAPSTKLSKAILQLLKNEGFISDYEVITENIPFPLLNITLRYSNHGGAMNEIKRVSKPSCRIYTSVDKLKLCYNGFGLYALSTVKGILSSHEAKKMNVGGELLFYVF